jgi:hypothetical protein
MPSEVILRKEEAVIPERSRVQGNVTAPIAGGADSESDRRRSASSASFQGALKS